jgi:hypothetical protein
LLISTPHNTQNEQRSNGETGKVIWKWLKLSRDDVWPDAVLGVAFQDGAGLDRQYWLGPPSHLILALWETRWQSWCFGSLVYFSALIFLGGGWTVDAHAHRETPHLPPCWPVLAVPLVSSASTNLGRRHIKGYHIKPGRLTVRAAMLTFSSCQMFACSAPVASRAVPGIYWCSCLPLSTPPQIPLARFGIAD